jgi:Mrp family chromosome partitioning ATPase/uncharacterized protein involved in exopolysaccharide biosynthesis
MNQVSYRLLRHDLPAASYSFRRPSESYVKSELGVSLLANEELFGDILDKKLNELSSLDAVSEDERLLQKVIDVYDYDQESILHSIEVRRLNNSDYLEIKASSENPALSAFITNTICGELIRYYGNIQKNQSNVPLESLATTVLESKRNLDEKMNQLQAYSADNEMVNPTVESTSKISQLKDYEDRVSTERQNIRALELTIANFNVRVQDAELVASPQRINEEAGQIKRKINSLNERYITSGQSDERTLDSLKTWRSKLEQFNQRIAEAPRFTPAELKTLKDRRDQAKVDLQIARENLNSLNGALGSMRNNLGDFANKEATRKLMEEELALAREEYLLAQSRYAAVKDKVLASNLEIKQIVYGEPAHKPKIRKAVALVGGSGLISFLLCAFVLFIREAGDLRIRSAQRLKSFSKIPSIGQIPALPRSIKNPSWSFFLDSVQSDELSRLNDELRKIRFTMESYNAQVFLLTSTQKGQGKSFIVMALAYTLSLARKRTLIIDTNLRHNSLTRLLTARVNLKQSLEYYNNSVKQLTTGEDTQEHITQFQGKLITNTYNEFVDVIGNKTSHLSPSEIIPGADFKVLLNWLKVRYDYILMEGSSLNDNSDSRELVAFADKVIPVFSADAVLNEEDRESLHFLRSLNGKLGCGILNRVIVEESSSIAAVF